MSDKATIKISILRSLRYYRDNRDGPVDIDFGGDVRGDPQWKEAISELIENETLIRNEDGSWSAGPGFNSDHPFWKDPK